MSLAPLRTSEVTGVPHGTLVGGRVGFRYYDNDSRARRRGTYDLKSAVQLWTRSTMTALTPVGSHLHHAVIAFRDAPSSRRPCHCGAF